MAFIVPFFAALGGGPAAAGTAATAAATAAGATATAATAAGTAAAAAATTAAATTGAITAATTLLGLAGSLSQAKAMKSASKAEQVQLDFAAGQAEASSQREAIEERRRADLLISRGLAVGAASGAGVSGISGILEGIAGRGEEAAGAARYEGVEKANEMRYRGAVGVSTAKSQASATTMSAVGKAGGSIYERFAA